jgi:mannosyl-3-phosphoglycerate synthase
VSLPAVREAIVDFMVAQGGLAPGAEPPRERIYPPVGSLDRDLLRDVLDTEARTFHQIGTGALADKPSIPGAVL